MSRSILFIFCFALGACTSSKPHPIATQNIRESSSKIVSRSLVPMDDTEARQHAPGGNQASTQTKKTMTPRPNYTTEVRSTTTETVVGTQVIAAPDSDINPQ